MKTGKPTRLSEKLNAELDTIRQDYAASMASQLESFRTDLQHIVTIAQRTIETDIRTFLNRPGFTGGQNFRRIAHYGTVTQQEDLEAVFT